jgi:hypothetical protein
MTKKDKASPRQRQIMEERWANARKACGEGSCQPNYKFHMQGCTRRDNKAVTLPAQKVLVTNLVTGEVVDASIDHSDARAVKNVLEDHDKQAVRLEPQEDENWSRWEKGLFEDRMPVIETQDDVIPPPGPAYLPPEPAPVLPWWKRIFRRG